MDEMELGLGLDVNSLLAGVERIEQSAGKASDSVKGIEDGLKKSNEEARRLIGPFQQLERAQAMRLQLAATGGSEAQHRDVELKYRQAQRAVERAERILNPAPVFEKTQVLPPDLDATHVLSAKEIERAEKTARYNWNQRQDIRNSRPPKPVDDRTGRYDWNDRAFVRGTIPEDTQLQKVAKALLSSRFSAGGAGGGLMPLVGRSLDAAGISPQLVSRAISNPYITAGGIILAGAYEVSQQLKELADSAARATESFANQRFISGGTTAEQAQLRAFGVSGTTARGVYDRISSDPTAAMFAARFGVTNSGGPLGRLDSAQGTLRIIEGLRGQSRESQQRTLQAIPELQTEEVMRLLRVSRETFERIKKDGEVSSRIFTEQQERVASEYNASKSRAQQAFENLTTSIGQDIEPFFTTLFNKIADGINYAADRKTGQAYLEGPQPWDTSSPTAPAMTVPEKQLKEQQKTNEALAAIHKSLGGGPRSNSAVPQDLNGMQINRAREYGALYEGLA